MSIRKRLRRLFGPPEPYQARDFARRDHLRDDYRILATGLLGLLDFESIVDVGCASGFLLG